MTLSVALPTRRATLLLARRLATILQVGDLVLLSGNLGAGKTFFVRGLARSLDLDPRERVTSPTFTLVHELPTSTPIRHADLYRLQSPRDLRELGLLEARDEAALLVEWGRPFLDALGGDALCIDIALSPRTATIAATGERSKAMLNSLAQTLPLPAPGARRGDTG
ncbi:MAG: hypothetical protein RJA70_656 [Pseudomonadota bacterium]